MPTGSAQRSVFTSTRCSTSTKLDVFGEDTHRGWCAGTDFDRLGGVANPAPGTPRWTCRLVPAWIARPDEVVDAVHPEHLMPELGPIGGARAGAPLRPPTRAGRPPGWEVANTVTRSSADALGDHPDQPVVRLRGVGGVEGAQHRLEAVHHQHRHRVGCAG